MRRYPETVRSVVREKFIDQRHRQSDAMRELELTEGSVKQDRGASQQQGVGQVVRQRMKPEIEVCKSLI
jgi:hypothetical protein